MLVYIFTILVKLLTALFLCFCFVCYTELSCDCSRLHDTLPVQCISLRGPLSLAAPRPSPLPRGPLQLTRVPGRLHEPRLVSLHSISTTVCHYTMKGSPALLILGGGMGTTRAQLCGALSEVLRSPLWLSGASRVCVCPCVWTRYGVGDN